MVRLRDEEMLAVWIVGHQAATRDRRLVWQLQLVAPRREFAQLLAKVRVQPLPRTGLRRIFRGDSRGC